MKKVKKWFLGPLVLAVANPLPVFSMEPVSGLKTPLMDEGVSVQGYLPYSVSFTSWDELDKEAHQQVDSMQKEDEVWVWKEVADSAESSAESSLKMQIQSDYRIVEEYLPDDELQATQDLISSMLERLAGIEKDVLAAMSRPAESDLKLQKENLQEKLEALQTKKAELIEKIQLLENQQKNLPSEENQESTDVSADSFAEEDQEQVETEISAEPLVLQAEPDGEEQETLSGTLEYQAAEKTESEENQSEDVSEETKIPAEETAEKDLDDSSVNDPYEDPGEQSDTKNPSDSDTELSEEGSDEKDEASSAEALPEEDRDEEESVNNPKEESDQKEADKADQAGELAQARKELEETEEQIAVVKAEIEALSVKEQVVAADKVNLGGNTPNLHEMNLKLAALEEELAALNRNAEDNTKSPAQDSDDFQDSDSMVDSDLSEEEGAEGQPGTADETEARKEEILAELETMQQTLEAMKMQDLYRMYNPNSGEHFYTSAAAERDSLIKAGWKYEGVGWKIPVSQGQNVYRLYNLNSGLHHYTTSVAEKNNLISLGWRDEGIGWKSDQWQGMAVYRQYNPNGGQHNFTISQREDQMLQAIGWNGEGTAFYARFPWSVVYKVVEDTQTVVFYDENDQLVNGEQEIAGYWYYFDPSLEGAMRQGLVDLNAGTSSEKTVYYGDTGKMRYGELYVEGAWRYFDGNDGHMLKDEFRWVPEKPCTFYYDENGCKVFGDREIHGKKYRFSADTGIMKRDVKVIMQQVISYINQNKGSQEYFSAALRLLDGTGEMIWNNKAQQSASVMKLFVMGAIYEKYDTYCQAYGKSNIDNNLYYMITVSDNDAWVYLVTVLGMGNYDMGRAVLENWNKAHGYNDTWMSGVAYGNYTSAHDASKILQDMACGVLKGSSAMMDLIQKQAVPGRLLAGIPDGVAHGNKPGWVYDSENDTVIVFASSGVYVLTVLSTNLTNCARSREMMGVISKMVYEYLQS